MRQGQHKNRSRGRSQRRPGGNPANRVYESNGPDVKVRGTAQTVADKYLQLARDAVSSGDIVMSESYFQHAEHYNRIIAANQSQSQQQRSQQENAPASDGGGQQQQPEAAPGTGPQPVEASSGDGAAARSNGDARGGKGGKDKADDVASFDGDLPQFLQQPADDSDSGEKPKRGRRSSRSKTAKADGDEAGEAGEAKAESKGKDAGDEPASDAEAVAS